MSHDKSCTGDASNVVTESEVLHRQSSQIIYNVYMFY
jgi:hypothetical protein